MEVDTAKQIFDSVKQRHAVMQKKAQERNLLKDDANKAYRHLQNYLEGMSESDRSAYEEAIAPRQKQPSRQTVLTGQLLSQAARREKEEREHAERMEQERLKREERAANKRKKTPPKASSQQVPDIPSQVGQQTISTQELKKLAEERSKRQQQSAQPPAQQQSQNGKPIAWYKSPRLVQGLGATVVTAAALATLFVGLKWYQKKQISRVVTKYGLMQDDFTDHQQNLLAAALLASYRVPQAVSKLQILVDQGVGSASVPKKQMWQILAELYWRKPVDQAKIAEFKKLVK